MPVKRPRGPARKRGRPFPVIDWGAVDRLLAIQCTLREVAAFIDVSEDTVERAVQREHGMGFRDYSAQKGARGLVSLRRKQFEIALAGDKTMLIWLGKQHLGQADKLQTESRDLTLEELIAAAEDDERGTPE